MIGRRVPERGSATASGERSKKRILRDSLAALLGASCLACAPATTLHAPAAASGWRTSPAGSQQSRCLPDVSGAFERLAREGRPMRFRIGRENSLGTPLWGHVQGVARLPGVVPAWVVSRSGGDSIAAIVVGEGGPAGGRDVLATIAAPPDADHAGGVQMLEDLLVIPFANRNGRSYVRFYDLSAPKTPIFLGELMLEQAGAVRYDGHASNVAIARLADGRLLLLSGAHSTRAVEAFVTSDPWTGEGRAIREHEWRHAATLYREIEPGLQTIALLPQCDGTLFLAGARNSRIPPPAFGRDRLRLYRLREADGGVPRLDEERAVHIRCDMCNFAAGVGPFITSDGQLVVYAAPHSDREGVLTIEAFAERR